MASHGVSRTGGGPPASAEARGKELKKIAEYQELVAAVNTRISDDNYNSETLDITSRLLIWNPEYYTVWNHRRRVFRYLLNRIKCQAVENANERGQNSLKDVDALISNDLDFLIPLLRKFPKCYWIWNYRLWLLEESTLILPASQACKFWEQELALINKMLNLDSRNFHGWGYRRRVVAALERPALQLVTEAQNLTEEEFKYTTRVVNNNLSNFSAWHYRSKLIPKLLEERHADHQARRTFLEGELKLIQRALWTGDQDQSLWFYHQNLMCTFHPKFASLSIAPDLSQDERIGYVSGEISNIMDMIDGAEDCKYIYQALIHMSTLYKSLSHEWPRQADDLPKWLSTLKKLDPLRVGRWNDLSEQVLKRDL